MGALQLLQGCQPVWGRVERFGSAGNWFYNWGGLGVGGGSSGVAFWPPLGCACGLTHTWGGAAQRSCVVGAPSADRRFGERQSNNSTLDVTPAQRAVAALSSL